MSGFELDEDGRPRAAFVFRDTYTGFRGHFPGNPVLPAVCTIQAALVLLSEWRSCDVRLARISSAKFYSMVTPGMQVQFACTMYEPDGAEAKATVEANTSEDRVAKLSLSAVCEPREEAADHAPQE